MGRTGNRTEGCPGARSTEARGAAAGGGGVLRPVSRPRAGTARAPAAPVSGEDMQVAGTGALVRVGSFSGSFPFSCCLQPPPDQRPGQSWDPPTPCMSSSRSGDHHGLMTPSPQSSATP